MERRISTFRAAPGIGFLTPFGVALLAAAVVTGEPVFVRGLFAGMGMMFLVLGFSFQHLMVEDEGDRLAIVFGPLPLFTKRIRYEDIREVEVGRTSPLDGWGIHMSLRGGWVWNIWGRDCVIIHHHRRGILWVGTDDAKNLAGFLKARIGSINEPSEG